jgi:hypothetical protein
MNYLSMLIESNNVFALLFLILITKLLTNHTSTNKLIIHELLEDRSEYQQNLTKYQSLQMSWNFPWKKKQRNKKTKLNISIRTR